MKCQEGSIDHIPALLWGEPADRLLIAVHGNQSHKADTVIALLADIAVGKGYQMLSFDLPEHGARRETEDLCKVQTAVHELRAVLRYARAHSDRISLFGCSLGAFFSLMAYRDERLERCLFLSPVVDMCRLIGNMMQWAGISEERLREEGEIPTSFGNTLYWDYYCYVNEHPVDFWNTPTAILHGERDMVSEPDRVRAFAERFRCELMEMPEGEHFFHTESQLDFFRSWVRQSL